MGQLSQQWVNANQFAKFCHMTHNMAKGVQKTMSVDTVTIHLCFFTWIRIVDGLASIVARVPLDTLLKEILERPDFTTTPAQAAIIHNADALTRLLFNHPETHGLVRKVAFEVCTEKP
jgi:hypothetical protein